MLRTWETIYSEERDVAEDSYVTVYFELRREADVRVTIEALSGPKFEFWTMSQDSFRTWEDAARRLGGKTEFTFYEKLSARDIYDFAQTARLPAGRHYVLVDNSDLGAVQPPANFKDDALTVSIIVEVR